MTVAVVDAGVHASRDQLSARPLTHWRAHPIEFIETVLFDPETGCSFKLLPAERAFLTHAFNRRQSQAALQRVALTAVLFHGKIAFSHQREVMR